MLPYPSLSSRVIWDLWLLRRWETRRWKAGRLAGLLFVCLFSAAHPPVSAADFTAALDSPRLSWQSGGSIPWTVQTVNTHDGVDAAQSGTIGDGEQSWIETTVV